MVKVAIAYHSTYGHTAAQAEAVKRGVEQVEGVEVALIKVSEIEDKWQLLHEADDIIFGCPTYMGSG